MFRDLFFNRRFIGALAFFVLMVVSGILYLQHVERQGQIELERTREALKQLEERNKKPSAVDTSQGGHFHADGTWHAEPHEAQAPVEITPVPPQGPVTPLSDAEIPEDVPTPDIPLPDDLKNIDLRDWKEWRQKHRAEWQKYIHALDPAIERLGKEVEQLSAALPPASSPEYRAARTKYNPKMLEYNRLITEKGWRIHQAAAAGQSASEKYSLARYGKK